MKLLASLSILLFAGILCAAVTKQAAKQFVVTKVPEWVKSR
jgi:hypothetical protein